MRKLLLAHCVNDCLLVGRRQLVTFLQLARLDIIVRGGEIEYLPFGLHISLSGVAAPKHRYVDVALTCVDLRLAGDVTDTPRT